MAYRATFPGIIDTVVSKNAPSPVAPPPSTRTMA